MEKVEVFYKFFEIENREAFSPDAYVSVENFSRLIGEYNFDEQVVCQVERSGGKCGHFHNRGWVGVTKDGCEVLVGNVCANKYFKADKTFALEKKRVRNEIDFQRYSKIINECLDHQDEIEEDMEDIYSDVKQIRQLQRNILACIPIEMVKFIRNAEKTKNRSVSIDIKYVEVDDEGKSHISWVAYEIGKLKSAGFIDLKKISDFYSNINDIKNIFSEIDLSNERRLSKIKKWSDKLSSRHNIIKDVNETKAECLSFISKDNLNLLLLISSNESDRRKVVDLINYFHDSHINNPNQYIEKYESDIKQAIGNREFRLSL